MPLPNPKDHRISLKDAAAQTKGHRDSAGKDPVKGGLFLRKSVDELLAQPGVAGVRFYFGRNAKNEPTIVLVGVDPAENDLTAGVLLNEHFFCPPFCGSANALNS